MNRVFGFRLKKKVEQAPWPANHLAVRGRGKMKGGHCPGKSLSSGTGFQPVASHRHEAAALNHRGHISFNDN
jgi:hypothetical protein